MQYLTIALPKGRLLGSVFKIFEEAGYSSSVLKEENSRKLIMTDDDLGFKFILTKPTDVPTYVEHGAADMGIVGKDIILEYKRDVCELLDLGIGYCKLVVAVPEKMRLKSVDELPVLSRVATSFPNIALDYFNKRGLQVEVIKVHGSCELAPLVELADAIVDITSTGQTLKENGLVEIADITRCTARLICNRVSYKVQYKRIDSIIEKISSAADVNGRCGQ
jgi:ATP phosphoribosyltransferase